MEKQIVRLPSKLYRSLFLQGGDKLIAVFCILKSARGKQDKFYAYKSKNNRTVSGYALLRAKTNLSLSVIKKYVPVLIDMGLCHIDNNGNFCIAGNNKLNKEFNAEKLVPIRLGKNLMETSLNTIAVRLSSNQRQQKKQIDVKLHRRDLIMQISNPKSKQDYHKAKKIVANFGKEISVTECVVLSNQGFACLKDGTTNNKYKGAYWKKKLKKGGLILTKRRYAKIARMSYLEYKSMRKNGAYSSTTRYQNGWMVEEVVSSYNTIDLLTGEVIY